MAAHIKLPDGSFFEVKPGQSYAEAMDVAAQQYPEAFGIQQKRGFIEATKAGAKQGIGAGLRGLGSFIGSDRLDAAGQAMLAPDQTPGAYRETTAEDVDAAYKQSLLSGLGSQFSKNISEPLGGMIGRYAVPTAVGAGAGMAAAAFAPELALGGIGAGALGEAAGFIGADLPMEQGENISRQEEFAKQRQEQGLEPLPYSKTETIAASLAQAALMPVLGGVGSKLFTPLIKIMGPELAATAKMVERGELTQEAAISQLNSTAKNLLVKSGETTAIGAPMMVGTEALRRGQAGQDVTGEEAQKAYGENLKAALAFAPIGGVIGGARARAGQVKMLEGAGDIYRTKATAEQAAKDLIDQRAAAMQATPEGETASLGLEEPQQPKGGAAAYAKLHPAEGMEENVIGSGYFNRLGIANKGDGKELRKQFTGMSLDHPEVITELKTALEAHAEAHPEKATAIEAALKDPMFAEQLDLGLPSLEEQQDAWQQAIQDKETARQAAEAARTKQKGAETRAAKEVGQTPGEGGTMDMFSGAEANRVVPEVEPAPAKTQKQFEAQNQMLYADFEAANGHWQKTGDDAPLKAVLAKAKKQLGPMQEKRDQASTLPLFDKKGRPTDEAAIRETEKTAEPVQPADRGESDVLPVSEAAGAEPAGLGVEPEGVGTSIRADERPVVAEKPEPAALKTKPGVSDKVAAREWGRSGAAAAFEQTYNELHPEAQQRLRGILDENRVAKRELTGKQLKEVMDTHVEASARRSARTGVKAEATHTKAEAELMVNNIKEKWTNAPEIKVRNLDELDAEAQAWVKKNKAKGFIDDKTGGVVIVSDRNLDLPDVKATLFHEVLGHYGLRSRFRDGLDKLMQDVYTTTPELRVEVDRIMERSGERSPARAMEEMLAERQIEGKVEQKLLSRVRAWIQNFLREHGVNLSFNEHDLRAILRQAHEEVVSGKKSEGPVGGARAARIEEPRFSDDIPAKTRVTLEHEGPDGEPVIAEVNAKTEMRAAERRLNALEKLLECVNA